MTKPDNSTPLEPGKARQQLNRSISNAQTIIGGESVPKYHQLQQTLDSLLYSANKNQATQDKFSKLELYFLESGSFDSLMERLLVDLKTEFKLSQLELLLFDPNSDIQQLLGEIYGQFNYPNLVFVPRLEKIKQRYPSQLKTRLTQDHEEIAALFPNQPVVSKSAAQLPLTRGNQVIGSLHIGSRDHARFSPDLETHFLQHLGSIICVCIENNLNQERFKHLSLVDILTRAKNRRYFFQALAIEIARSARSQQPIACLFLDLDHFKSINDTHGHLVGDKTLKQVAACIQPLLRQSDVFARFGGEEFTVLLVDSDKNQAIEIAERIRSQVAALEILDDAGKAFQVTVSIGLSHWQPESPAFKGKENILNQLVNEADKAVYVAKQQGRNCIHATP